MRIARLVAGSLLAMPAAFFLYRGASQDIHARMQWLAKTGRGFPIYVSEVVVFAGLILTLAAGLWLVWTSRPN